MSRGIERRDFLKVLGVSGAGAALTGCSTKNAERLLPYVTLPEDITPGVATWYTTVCDGCSAQCGMWVRTREGRAVKLEGNPRHPISNGALCSRGHASLQHLYNPDRYSGPMIRENGQLRTASWDEAEKLLADKLGAAGGKVLYIGKPEGPTQTQLVEDFLKAVGGGRRVEYETVSDAPLREAMRMAFGYDGLPRYDIEGSRFLISFGSDFLESGISPVEDGRAFSHMSAVDSHGTKGRFVFVGPRLSLTGFNADDWMPIKPGAEAAVALGMASAIAESSDAAGPYASALRAYDPGSAARAAGITEDDIRQLARRFASQGPSLALGPGTGAHHRNATAANLAVLILNAVAGNVGRTLHLDGGATVAARPYADLEDGIRAMAGSEVSVAMIHGVNPAYSLPTASGFNDAFSSVDFKVSFASAPDETAAMADLILPDRHFLESWGDSSARPGLFALRQPVMEPVPHFDAKQTADVLLAVASRLGHDLGGATFYEYLQAAHRRIYKGADFDRDWRERLRRGVWKVDTAAGATSGELHAPDKALVFDVPTLDGDGDLTLLVHPSPRFGGGEHSNAPWLLEMPDQVSKITWHSWLEMHPETVEAHGLREGDIVTVTSPYGSVEVPVWPYPGIRPDAVALAMGMGHTDFGRWATGNGVNAMDLLPAVTEQPSGAFVTIATKVSVTPTGKHRRLASVSGSTSEAGRPIAPAITLAALGHGGEPEGEGEVIEELSGTGGFVPIPSPNSPNSFPLEGSRHGMYENPESRARWGMAIDLDKCTGCSACVTACMSENNVPWVGEEQVLMGREMHWIRIETYWERIDAKKTGAVDVRVIPMLCQHCSNAPCEPVCPVFATISNPEGVNVQIYNRCVGTRYCSNNCPYKVRTFNWLRYTDAVPEPMNWQWNPDVTVRDNGVMEKCSFCIQRVREAENRVALEDRGSIPKDGEVVMACQQSCPAEAIVWGDLRDPQSRVSQVAANERTYRVLNEHLNTQPGVNYLKKVTFHQLSAEEGA